MKDGVHSMCATAVYSAIARHCEDGYSLVDERSGLPLVGAEDVEDSGCGFFTVRFRVPVGKERMLERVARRMCEEVGSELHLFVKDGEEYGVPFKDCVWVIDPQRAPKLTERQGGGQSHGNN